MPSRAATGANSISRSARWAAPSHLRRTLATALIQQADQMTPLKPVLGIASNKFTARQAARQVATPEGAQLGRAAIVPDGGERRFLEPLPLTSAARSTRRNAAPAASVRHHHARRLRPTAPCRRRPAVRFRPRLLPRPRARDRSASAGALRPAAQPQPHAAGCPNRSRIVRWCCQAWSDWPHGWRIVFKNRAITRSRYHSP